MTIHNLMEDFVFNEVNKVFDAANEKKEPWFICNCLQCRLDTVCYVLNRIQPRYIRSGRGMAHFMEFDRSEKTQLIADISISAFEGMKIVFEAHRSHTAEEQALPAGPVFNFPAMSGRIVDGQSFSPVHDLSTFLYLEDRLAPQITSLWHNPYVISEKTPGVYTFWPFPVPAASVGENRIFNFYIHAEREGYEPIHYHFKLGLTSDSHAKSSLDGDNCHTLPDLYLFEE